MTLNLHKIEIKITTTAQHRVVPSCPPFFILYPIIFIIFYIFASLITVKVYFIFILGGQN